jgi:hypothetical protein
VDDGGGADGAGGDVVVGVEVVLMDVDVVVGVVWCVVGLVVVGSTVTVTYTRSVTYSVRMTRLSMGLATARSEPARARAKEAFILKCEAEDIKYRYLFGKG